ncbi:L-threonylcarbamoyladenylate synthase [Bacillus suaedaesalsae]|uniref:Threonylcarbamoyl-AMP synthase n=1 Tax=Bacillus suaedaesalsae TaxID=2810349 RepID=A0ABS2DE69_9BACI|nr:L-threonylcarbamoyladenylate synthase [Bacillus suaedaesalsae]MBM6616761.1 threonylcarbamoyl-AMP synthase [Bacillus suaedaesalsae]
MNTKVWLVDNTDNLSTSFTHITEAAHFLQHNEVVAFPTETVYGLGGNATSTDAVDKIFNAKGRPGDNPLIVHISNVSQLNALVTDVPSVAEKLMDAFWPGPLTIIFQAKDGAVSDRVTAGLSTVAIRMPDHPVALALIEESGLPLAAPSANLSGKPSPTTAQHVFEDLNGRIAGIVDGGPTGVGLESTVVDCTEVIPTILRPGGVTKVQIEEVVGRVGIDPAIKSAHEAPKSPGMKYTHYAPKAPLFIVEGTTDFLQMLVDQEKAEGKKVGVLATTETVPRYKADVVLSCGSREDLSSIAQNLYDSLRRFDHENIDIILSETFPATGVGEAIMNRLEKAAGFQKISEK